jgi:hypothetical protein
MTLISLVNSCCPELCLKDSIEGRTCRDMHSINTRKLVGVYCVQVHYSDICKCDLHDKSCGWVCNTTKHKRGLVSIKYPIYIVDIQGYHTTRNYL